MLVRPVKGMLRLVNLVIIVYGKFLSTTVIEKSIHYNVISISFTIIIITNRN